MISQEKDYSRTRYKDEQLSFVLYNRTILQHEIETKLLTSLITTN